MSTAEPRTTREPGRPAVRERILLAAHRHFERVGYRRANVAGIARDAGLSAGALYRYFDGKEELFKQVVERVTDLWIATARDVAARPLPAVERLALLGEASVRYARDNRIHSSILNKDDEIIFAPLLDGFYQRLTRATLEQMTGLVRDAIEEGSLRPVDPEKTAVVLFTGGAALMEQEQLPYEEVFPQWGDIVMRGLLPR